MQFQREAQQVDDYLQGCFGWLRRQRGIFYGAVAAAIVVIWLASGIYVVQPGEEGVVRTFGRFTGVATAGLNYHVPWPVQSATIVDVESIYGVGTKFTLFIPAMEQG